MTEDVIDRWREAMERQDKAPTDTALYGRGKSRGHDWMEDRIESCPSDQIDELLTEIRWFECFKYSAGIVATDADFILAASTGGSSAHPDFIRGYVDGALGAWGEFRERVFHADMDAVPAHSE
jgi:hypothetical protein